MSLKCDKSGGCDSLVDEADNADENAKPEKAAVNQDAPPESNHLDGWRMAVREGHYTRYRLESIVAAIQDLRSSLEPSILNLLAKHLSDALHRILRDRVGFHHSNRGLDIIERTHGHIIEAVFQPTTADGRALRFAFVPRVTFRIRSAIVCEYHEPWKRPRTTQEIDDSVQDEPQAYDPSGTDPSNISIGSFCFLCVSSSNCS